MNEDGNDATEVTKLKKDVLVYIINTTPTL